MNIALSPTYYKIVAYLQKHTIFVILLTKKRVWKKYKKSSTGWELKMEENTAKQTLEKQPVKSGCCSVTLEQKQLDTESPDYR